METMALSLAGSATKPLLGKLLSCLAQEAQLLARVEDDVVFIADELKSMVSFLKVTSSRNNDEQIKTWIEQVNEMAYDAEDAVDAFAYHHQRTHNLFFTYKVWKLLATIKPRHDIATALQKIKLRAREVSERRTRFYLPNSGTGGAAAAATAADFSASLLLTIEDKLRTRCNPCSWDNSADFSASLLLTIEDKLRTRYNPCSWDDSAAADHHDPLRLSRLFEEARPVGIDANEDNLIRVLMDESHPELVVITLVGFPGSGKTTLAEHIYQSRKVTTGHFTALAWISVSRAYDNRTLLQAVIREFSISDHMASDALGLSRQTKLQIDDTGEADLEIVVKNYLQDKRYLIVLDDILAVKAWEDIKLALPDSKNGSRIITTTCIEKVAEACSSLDNGDGHHHIIFRIPPLSTEASRDLFCKKVFDGPEYGCPQHLKKTSDEILTKCGGLPLAIITIAGLLAAKPDTTVEEWEKVNQKLHFNLQQNPTMDGLEQVLTVAYNDLPSNLKPCFLYLSVFPKYYKISKKRLLRRWVAEGLVVERHGMSAEQVGGVCFDELIKRSLITPFKIDYDGRVRSFTVHDITVELIVSISMQQNFVSILSDRSPSILANGKIRRLSLHETGTLKRALKLSHIRSLTTFGDRVHLHDYGRVGLLRVLDLDGCKNLTRNDLKGISKLFLLTFLSLRNSSRIDGLPEAIGHLQNLQVLDIRGTRIRELPGTVVKLRNLSHLLGGNKLSQVGGTNCFRMPRGLGKMKKLRNLGVIDGSCEGDSYSHVLREIGELTQLDKLKISFSKGFPGRDSFCKSLSKLNSCLRTLQILVDGGDHSLKLALHDLSKPPLLLREIHIQGRMETLPTWFWNLRGITKITLHNTLLKQRDAMLVLKNLPALLKLVLRGDSFAHHRSSCDSDGGGDDREEESLVFDSLGFAWLRLLQVESLGMTFQPGALPNLEMLTLNGYGGCGENNKISGVAYLHKLCKIRVDACDEAVIRGMLTSELEKSGKNPRWIVASNTY